MGVPISLTVELGGTAMSLTAVAPTGSSRGYQAVMPVGVGTQVGEAVGVWVSVRVFVCLGVGVCVSVGVFEGRGVGV